MTMPVPTEEVEQIAVVNYCRLRNLPCFHVPNSTWTTSIQIKMRNKRLGVSSGVPDLFVIIPRRAVIAIEMKRIKGGVLADTQREWGQILNEAGLPTYVAHGAEAAIAIIEKHLKDK